MAVVTRLKTEPDWSLLDSVRDDRLSESPLSIFVDAIAGK
jgi:hypothetical protein